MGLVDGVSRDVPHSVVEDTLFRGVPVITFISMDLVGAGLVVVDGCALWLLPIPSFDKCTVAGRGAEQEAARRPHRCRAASVVLPRGDGVPQHCRSRAEGNNFCVEACSC